MNSAIRDRMLVRLSTMEEKISQPVGPDTFSMFEATRLQRDDLEAQRRDAITWASQLEGGTDAEEHLAEGLTDYAQALETALDPQAQAPHARCIRAGLEKKLEPEQLEQVLADPRIEHAWDASMENALYSGRELLTRGESKNMPFIYTEHHRAWVQTNAAVILDGQPLEYTPAAEVHDAVNEVLTEEQRITQDQREMDASMLAGQPQLAEALGVSSLDRHAQHLYGTPMIDNGPLAPATNQPSAPVAPEAVVQTSPQHSSGPGLT